MTPTNHTKGDGHDGHDGHDTHNAADLHEHSDVNVRALLTFAVGLAVVTVVSAIIVWGLFRYLEHEAAANDPQRTPLAAPSSVIPPAEGIKGADPGVLTSFPEPRLQIDEPAGLKKLHDAEAQTLENYGWVDQKAGVARMPIEEAKKLILQRGMPARAGAQADALLGTHAQATGEASGGRTLTRSAGSRQ